MKFRTEYKVTRSSIKLEPSCPVVLVGSCFAANIASKMHECMWRAYNGIGTLYNPMSIANVLDLLIFHKDSSDLESSLFVSDGKVHSWLFDSHFSATSEEKCLEKIECKRAELIDALEGAQALIVTFGTAWCYELIEAKSEKEYIVANCHKMPSSLFRRRRVSLEEISNIWIDLCRRLKQRYPKLSVIFTVSPVRHLKDGFEGNTLSKATLHLAVEHICDNLEWCQYFPAYELLCDDLRDYRFYASDLVHPSESAVEYIWEVFCQSYLDEKGMVKIKEGSKEYKRINHRSIIQ